VIFTSSAVQGCLHPLGLTDRQPVPLHGSLPHHLLPKLPQGVLGADVQVDFCCLEVIVAERLLQAGRAHACPRAVHRKCVAQNVRRHRLHDATRSATDAPGFRRPAPQVAGPTGPLPGGTPGLPMSRCVRGHPGRSPQVGAAGIGRAAAHGACHRAASRSAPACRAASGEPHADRSGIGAPALPCPATTGEGAVQAPGREKRPAGEGLVGCPGSVTPREPQPNPLGGLPGPPGRGGPVLRVPCDASITSRSRNLLAFACGPSVRRRGVKTDQGSGMLWYAGGLEAPPCKVPGWSLSGSRTRQRGR